MLKLGRHDSEGAVRLEGEKWARREGSTKRDGTVNELMGLGRQESP